MKESTIKKLQAVVNKQIMLKNDLTNYNLILKDFKKELEANGKKEIRVKDLVTRIENYKDTVERLDFKAREIAKDSYKQMAESIDLTLTGEEEKEEYESIEDWFVGIQKRVDEAVYEVAELRNIIKEIENIEL